MVTHIKKFCIKEHQKKAYEDLPTCRRWVCTFTHRQHLPPATETCALFDDDLSSLGFWLQPYSDTSHIPYPFKVCNSTVFSIVTELHHYHNNPFQNISIIPKEIPNSVVITTSPPARGITNLISISVDRTTSDVSYK